MQTKKLKLDISRAKMLPFATSAGRLLHTFTYSSFESADITLLNLRVHLHLPSSELEPEPTLGTTITTLQTVIKRSQGIANMQENRVSKSIRPAVTMVLIAAALCLSCLAVPLMGVIGGLSIWVFFGENVYALVAAATAIVASAAYLVLKVKHKNDKSRTEANDCSKQCDLTASRDKNCCSNKEPDLAGVPPKEEFSEDSFGSPPENSDGSAAGFRALVTDHLIKWAQSDGHIQMTFTQEAHKGLLRFVERESACCKSLAFAIEHKPSSVELHLKASIEDANFFASMFLQ